MKKFVKVCLILGAVLAVTGAALCVVGGIFGVDMGRFENLLSFRNNVLWKSNGQGRKIDEYYEGIRNLSLDIGVTSVKIQESGDNRFHVYGVCYDDNFSCQKDGDTLEVEGRRRWVHNSRSGEQLTIEIPVGTVFEEVEIDVGVGELDAAGLYCRELSIDCGVGSVSVRGRVEDECSIDCGVGEVSLNLENAQEDFDYQITCGIGDVVLGENSYSGISKRREIDNGTGRDMEIDCGMGSVMLTFSDSPKSAGFTSGNTERPAEESEHHMEETEHHIEGQEYPLEETKHHL